jgi:hypothetical protein
MAFLVELGQEVEIRIRSRSTRGTRAAVRVLHGA